MLPPKKLLENDANVTLASLCLLTEGFHFHFRSQSRDPSGQRHYQGLWLDPNGSSVFRGLLAFWLAAEDNNRYHCITNMVAIALVIYIIILEPASELSRSVALAKCIASLGKRMLRLAFFGPQV